MGIQRGKFLSLAGALLFVLSVSTLSDSHAQEALDLQSEMEGLPDFNAYYEKRRARAYGSFEFDPLNEDPTQGEIEQAVGFYSRGSLISPMNFPVEGDGFIKIMRPRDRGWATFDLVAVIEWAASVLLQDYPGAERVQIGDVSGIKGGQLSRHASHQNGLDADLVYLRMDRLEQDPDDTSGFKEDFVSWQGALSENFDLERNYRFMQLLSETGRINRIFVDSRIKSAVCRYSEERGTLHEDTEYLRILRPWKLHDDHMHVRITCPDNSPQCIPQQEPPEGSGCEVFL